MKKTIKMTAISTLLLFICCGTSPEMYYKINGKILRIPSFDIDLNNYESVQKRKNQQDNVALAVAISGGGYRASNFALGALLGLEEIGKNTNSWEREKTLLSEVDYFSTVSGGGLTAAAYFLTLKKHIAENNKEAYRLLKYAEEIKSTLRTNYESTIFWAFFNPKLMITSLDRGDKVEEAINENLFLKLNSRNLFLRDVFIPKGSKKIPRLPYWVANATIETNSARLPLTPSVLSKYKIAGYNHTMESVDKKHSKENFIYNIPYSVLVRASASFPGGISECTLKTDYFKNSKEAEKYKYLHINDGGISDNLGVHSAIRMLDNDKSKKKILIIIDAFNDDKQPFVSNERPLIFTNLSETAHATVRARQKYIKDLVSNMCKNKNIQYIFINLLDDDDIELKHKYFKTSLKIDVDTQKALVASGRRLAISKAANRLRQLVWE